MPIDAERLVGAELPATRSSWCADDVILYHLGVGAGSRPTDDRELEYTYEARLKVLPTFAVIPAFESLIGLADLDGFDVNLAMLLHGEQDLELRGSLPPSAELSTSARVTHVFDKGKGAVVVVEASTSDAGGRPLFVNRFSSFIRGEGGFGGDTGPPPPNPAPVRPADLEVERRTLPQQALLYRLNGDKNPMHADPAFAARGGFDRPILHGLCTYGIACKAVVDELLDGGVGKVARYQARFAGVVFPGETLVVRMWREADRVLLTVDTKDRGTAAITNAAITVRSDA